MHSPEFVRRMALLRDAGITIRDDEPGVVSAICRCGRDMGPDGRLAVRGERLRAYCAGCWDLISPDDLPQEVNLAEAICLAARKTGQRATIKEHRHLIDGEEWRLVIENGRSA